MPRLILTYHASRLDELSREGCDLFGLMADLAWLAENDVPVLPLDRLLAADCRHGVAITFDDGIRLDAERHDHPEFGELPSMLEVLQTAKGHHPLLQAATFVIASPEARAVLADALADDYGDDLMHDRWWQPAQAGGLLSVENHSWDHNHPLLPQSAQRDNLRGDFKRIETEPEAEAEIAAASDFIEQRTGRRPHYFAYPFGDVSPFLRDDYLPRRGPELGLRAAFSTEPAPLDAQCNRWSLPRYVSGRDWTTDAGLAALIEVAAD